MSEPILRLKNITKIFPHPEVPVIANDHVNFSVVAGEIHAIVGENGTGKTTLMNILYGMYQPDEGEIVLNNTVIKVDNPRHAIAHGIGMVHQHFMLIPSFTVAENLVFGFEPRKGLLVDIQEANRIARDISRTYGLEIDPEQRIQSCSLSMRQRVEVLKILYHGANILIFDEPTAVLTPQESNELFKAFLELKRNGKTIIFITHKLKEVMSVADRATVMRKGKVVDVVNVSETSTDQLAGMMVGRKVSTQNRKETGKFSKDDASILEVSHLKRLGSSGRLALNDISFSLGPGEILGIAGVGGNGQGELVECLTGLNQKAVGGRILYEGIDITKYDARRIRDLGIGHITGERHSRGASYKSSIFDNMIMGIHKVSPWCWRGVMQAKRLRQTIGKLIDDFNIKAASMDMDIANLSGGNIQKCIVARELNLARRVIVAEEPTRGVDIGAIEFIHGQLLRKSMEGYGIILVSTDLDEILALSTKILVMFEGRVTGEIARGNESMESRIGLMMAGISA